MLPIDGNIGRRPLMNGNVQITALKCKSSKVQLINRSMDARLAYSTAST